MAMKYHSKAHNHTNTWKRSSQTSQEALWHLNVPKS